MSIDLICLLCIKIEVKYIIVTGGAGFIGSSLIEFLIRKTKKKIISIDDYSTGKTNNHIINNRVTYIKSHTKDISKTLNRLKNKIDVIFHFAEFSRIAQSFEKIQKCFSSNIEGTFSVINFCLKNKIKIIYSATSASLGNNELDQHLSPYAYTKSNNMNLIMNLNEWKGLKYEIIYFYNVYGERQIVSSKMAAVVGIFENCIKKNKPLPVVLPGTQSRRFTHVKDTVKACYIAYKKNLNAHYSISSNKFYKIINLAKLFGKNIKYVPERKGERFESKIISKIRGKKIKNLVSRSSLEKHVKNIKKRHEKVKK